MGSIESTCIGVPLKYSDSEAIIPTYVAEFGYGMDVKCVGNEVVRFEKIQHWDEPDDKLKSLCREKYRMELLNMLTIWQRRLRGYFMEHPEEIKKWDMVRMVRVIQEGGES